MAKANPPRSLPRGADVGDLYDWVPTAATPRRRREAPRKVRARITVTDDWPDIIPVTEAELRVIEGHFGDLLDKLLGPRA
jgi:hypothetical protein